MFVTLRRLLLLAALSPACSVANPDHCANLEGDATCEQRGQERPWCSMCVGDNDGCLAERPAERCQASTLAAVTSTASTGQPTSGTSESSSGEVDPPVTTTSSSSGGESTSTGGSTGTSTGSGTSTGEGSSSTGEPFCGDGAVEGDEVCDGENTGEQTCAKLLPNKWGGGKLKCTAACASYDDTDCCIGVGQTCDPILAPDELCCDGLSCQLGTCKVMK